MQDDLKALAWKKNRTKVEEAYRAYIANEEGAVDCLFSVVLEFAEKKLAHTLEDTAEVCQTYQDLAQDVALYIWQNLGSMERSPSTFYSWVNRVCFTKGNDAHKNIRKEAAVLVPLQLEDEEGFMDDNPLLHVQARGEYATVLPDYFTRREVLVCKLIREGYDYKNIARFMVTTEDAVKKIVQRCRKKVENHKAQEAAV